MQDRYLFRGISTATDGIITGMLSVDLDGDYYIDNVCVCKNTVGQCTGLRDRNGTLIFEGDIVEFFSGEDDFGDWLATYGRPFVKFGDYLTDGWCHCGFGLHAECDNCEDFVIEGYGHHLFFSKTKETSSFLDSDAKKCLVVGNSYKNPELLEPNA